MAADEPQENTQDAEWWHKSITEFTTMIADGDNIATDMSTIVLSGASPLTLQISQLEQTVEALEKRIAALEAHNALSIEELEAELHARYDRHTRHVLHGGIHVV